MKTKIKQKEQDRFASSPTLLAPPNGEGQSSLAPADERKAIVLQAFKEFASPNSKGKMGISWKAAFEAHPEWKSKLVPEGQNGMGKAYAYASHLLKQEGLIEKSNKLARVSKKQAAVPQNPFDVSGFLGSPGRVGLINSAIFDTMQSLTSTMFNAALEMQGKMAELNRTVIMAGAAASQQ
jgi:hypothetical protein